MKSCRAAVLACGVVLAIATSTVSSAEAFCGFYVSGGDTKLFNNATQVALLRSGTRTVLSMQNNYQGPPEQFALVVPVPVVLQKENVKTLPLDVFAKIDQLSAPRLVEYWEQDPCYVPPPPREVDMAAAGGAGPAAPGPGGAALGGVKVEAQFAVGEYDIVILSAKDAGGLDAWLRANKYTIPHGAAAHFRPYVQRGSKFFVAKVDPQRVKFDKEMATLSPLRFHYDDESFSLPIRLGLINAKDAQDLVVYVLADDKRYEVANYPNVTIPTNIDLSEKAKTEFGSFYTALFDKTVEKTPKAVVTEYSWASSSCDPCPGPTLVESDMLTLGGDALARVDCSKPSVEHRRECTPGKRFAGYVLTRLHARYTKDSLGEDLVFRAAEPIEGGRETFSGSEQKLEVGATKSTINNFQGRYAIRHPWIGPVACKKPRRGIWAGPPAGTPPPEKAKAPAAKDLAMTTRGVPLASFVRSEIPEIGFKADPAALPSVAGHAVSPPKFSEGAGADTDQTKEAKASKCGCDAPGLPVSGSAALATAMAAGLAFVRRRR
jgi:hypothetical protein